MLALFTFTLFLSAALLFQVQPLFAKMLLPRLGGTPAVWNTCVVFFELALVVGYLYSHLTVKWLGVRRQALLHIGLLLLPLAALPIRINDAWSVPTTGNPIGPVFLLLLVSVGLPFFVVSTTAPLLQRWLGATTHPSARDPYFLYAASNVGSLLALLTYPTLVEPTLRLTTQSRVWAGGYGLLVVLVAACAWMMRRSLRDGDVDAVIRETSASADDAPAVSWATRLRWLALSAVPSSLMLSTTTYITSDVAAVPMLWVIPLAIYLLTFVLVFARRPLIPHHLASAFFPIAIIPAFIVIIREDWATLVTIPILLQLLFFAAMVCHGELVRTRPPAGQLTDFYLTMSIGGALGGLFNVLVAPLVFMSPAEFPIGIVLACMLRSPAARPTNRSWSRRDWWLDVALPMMLGVLMLVLEASAKSLTLNIYSSYWGLAHVYALPLAIWLAFWSRPIRMGLGLAVMIGLAMRPTPADAALLHAERSFFGIYHVESDGPHVRLMNGSTVHGMQLRNSENRCLPMTYYHPSGPVGQLMYSFTGAHAKFSIAVVGLGAGSMAGYARPGERWTFYEIDPVIERIATDDRYFTYLKACGEGARVVLGDARLTLGAVPDRFHDVIVLDAFNSDAVPVHLLTREAVELYFKKLAPAGVLAVHISNRFLDLKPVLEAVARDLGLVGISEDDFRMSPAQAKEGKLTSQWVVLARTAADFGELTRDTRWQPLSARPDTRAWTDDFSNIITSIKWGR